MVTTEQQVHERNTLAWIEADPVVLALTRTIYADDGAGGRVRTGEIVLPLQTMRIDRSTNMSIQFVTTPAGTEVPERFRLVGMPTADIASGDSFFLNGAFYQVTHVHRPTFGRVAAEAEYRG